MDARQHLFETRQTLKEVFETQAGWRAGKAAEYPDDKRNQKAAEIFRRLHDTLDDVPQDVIDAYQGVWDRLDSGNRVSH